MGVFGTGVERWRRVELVGLAFTRTTALWEGAGGGVYVCVCMCVYLLDVLNLGLHCPLYNGRVHGQRVGGDREGVLNHSANV